MQDEWTKVVAPATLSNLGPGFDVFGMALAEPFDTVMARRAEEGVSIAFIEGPGAESIPLDPRRNSAGIAAAEVLERGGADIGLELRIVKGIRPCSGIGSSGASAAGGAYVANLFLDEPLSDTELVLCAAHAEEVTSGGLHADNVAPSLLGGLTVIRSYEPLEVIRVEPPTDLGVVVAMPDVLVSTSEARKVLPSEVSVKELVFHVGHASALALAMARGDLDLLGRSVRDAVFEPARRHLVPHLKEAEDAAMAGGALASFLGGSGPCVIAFYDRSGRDGERIAASMREAFTANEVECETWVTTWGRGCRRIGP